jgi:hypothetical protein
VLLAEPVFRFPSGEPEREGTGQVSGGAMSSRFAVVNDGLLRAGRHAPGTARADLVRAGAQNRGSVDAGQVRHEHPENGVTNHAAQGY